MSELPECPKCKQKMVPFSGIVKTISDCRDVAIPLVYAEWRCTKCGHSIKWNNRPETGTSTE